MPLSGQQVNSSEVLAGENWTTPAPVILSMTSFVTPEAAAPMIACAPWPSSRSTVWFAVSVLSSPESPRRWVTGLPSPPPAALISLTATSTAANSGGPRKARLPVSGSNVPIFSGALLGCPLGVACGGFSHVVADGSPPLADPWSPGAAVLPPPQPAITTDKVPSRAATRSAVRCAMHLSSEQTGGLPASPSGQTVILPVAKRHDRPPCRDEDVIRQTTLLPY